MKKRTCVMMALVAAFSATLTAKVPTAVTPKSETVQEENEAPVVEYLRQENGDLYEMLGDSIVRIYRCVFDSEKDRLMRENPADNIYSHIWLNKWVNPYKVDPATIKDTVMISCDNFAMPLKKMRQTSPYGWRGSRMHYGVDFGLSVGDSVCSVWSGKVRVVDYDAGGYGNFVVVRHPNGLETVYGHLSAQLVVCNQEVKAGQAIGLGGNTGRSSGPHLHLETRYLGNAFNSNEIFDYTTGTIKNQELPLTSGLFRRSTTAPSSSTSRPVTNTPSTPAKTTATSTSSKTSSSSKSTSSKSSSSSSKSAANSKKYVTVKAGDNLSKIASRAGTTVSAVCKLNGIKPNKLLHPGDKIRVK